ncbi:MAG: helix-turn-helix domain-containing protein [Terriglobia bacterium]
MTPIENSRLVLQDLFRLWDERAHSYGPVLYGAAFAEQLKTWKVVLAFFLPLHKENCTETELTADYGDFRIARGILSLDEAKKVFSDIVETETLSLPNLPRVAVTATMYPTSSVRFASSSENRFPMRFPATEFSFSLSDACKSTPPQVRFYAVNLPSFPRGDIAIEDILKVHLGGFGAYCGTVIALAPDYRARISELRLSTKGVQVLIECLSAIQDDLIGKLYYETDDGKVLHGDLLFKDNQAEFAASGFPRELTLGLLSKMDGNLIDERTFYSGATYSQAGVVLQATEEDIERLILGGETSTLEFKKELPREREDFALEAAAFANTDGGRILVGVEDNARIVGASISKAKETIANIFRDYSEPSLNFDYEEVTVQGSSIIVITVPPGKNKPYVVKDKGVYVRSGATKRAATRYELDQIYNQKGRMDGLFGRTF